MSPAERKLSSSDSGTRSISVTFGSGEAACISLSLVQPTPSPESRNLISVLSFKIRAASKTDTGSCAVPAIGIFGAQFPVTDRQGHPVGNQADLGGRHFGVIEQF